MSAAEASEVRGPWAEELIAVVRAGAGGMLFGIPLLYTMEIWWTGNHTTPRQMLVVLALTFVPVFLLNRTAGFRDTGDIRFRDALMETVEAVGLGLILVTGVLILFREITLDTPPAVGLGKIVYEVMPFCIGIAVANHFLSRGRDAPDDDSGNRGSSKQNGPAINPTLVDIGATAIGAIFIALNIAPTDEVSMLAAAMSPQWLLAVMGFSLVISYGIVFVAGFGNQEARRAQVGIFQRPSTETVACYLVALLISALMLSFFQRAGTPWPNFLGQVVVLGLPATVGGAAGRLAI